MDGPQSKSLGSNGAHGDSSNPSSMDGPQSEPLVSNGAHHSHGDSSNPGSVDGSQSEPSFSLFQQLGGSLLVSNGPHHSHGDSSNPGSVDGPQSEPVFYLFRQPGGSLLVSNGRPHRPSNPENNEYDPEYAQLYQAVRTGNLEATRAILEGREEAVRARIETEGKRPLHVAALFGHLEIVKELLPRMSAADAALQDDNKLTALHEAIYGETEIAGLIIEKNLELLAIQDNQGLLPITRAFGFGQIKMVRYLYPLTPLKELQDTHGATLLNLCCYSKIFDIALDLLDKYPNLAVTPNDGGKTFLEAMASTPSAFRSGCQLSFWQRWIYNWIDIPKEQLRTTFNRVVHETSQPNSAEGDISAPMPETTTSQWEETITTAEGDISVPKPETTTSQREETITTAEGDISAPTAEGDISAPMPETTTSQREETITTAEGDISVPMPETTTSQREETITTAEGETISTAEGHISVRMPETTTSQREERITTKKKSNNNTMAFFGIKNIYQIKLAHMQALELLRIAREELLKLNEEQIQTSGACEAVVQATRKGIPEIFTEVLKVRLDLFWTGDGRCLMFDAVEFRQARVFSLIHGMRWKKAVANLIDCTRDRDNTLPLPKCNTLLHTAGLFGPSTELQLHGVSGAALQMQRELQWLKEVESITPSDAKEARNSQKLTGRQFFTKNHKELVKQGEKWMKGTATSCSVVAALVATIVFAAAFTVPGGNNQNTGYPIFSEKKGFMVFILSDALSLFSSTTSILMFLGILTSRYAEEDFLKSLPTKLIIGLLTLFISMASMLIAFCAALFIMLRGQLWIVIPVSFLAAVPVISFCWLQYPLLREMIMSTYGPSIFDRNVKPWATADLI